MLCMEYFAAMGTIRINSLRCKSRPKPHAMNTLHNFRRRGQRASEVYEVYVHSEALRRVVASQGLP
jgi:hypothetical protein